MWTVEAWKNDEKRWTTLPVSHKTRAEALKGATWVTFTFWVQTRVVKAS